MYEHEKLKEARYFVQRMETSVDDSELFQYDLSAFLSAARSVLRYALEEATKKPNERQWENQPVSV